MASVNDAPTRFRMLLLAGTMLGSACSAAPAPESGEGAAVLFRGGQILDGTGNPWYRGDVLVVGDRIARVGVVPAAEVPADTREVDAAGLTIMPGFIDPHSHAGPGLATPELRAGEPLIRQGITTVMVNPDGGGDVDLAAQRRRFEEGGIGVHVALMIGHGAVRREVLGMEARPPTEDEFERMAGLVRAGMDAGAFGMTGGLYYAPGSYAENDEVVRLAAEIAPFGAFSSHIRDESDYNIGLVAAVEEVIEVAEVQGIRGVVTHFKALGPPVWGLSREATAAIDAARARGVEIFADQYPYEASGTSIVGALVPRWALAGETMPGMPSPLENRLANPRERARLRADMLVALERRGGAATLLLSRHRADISLEGRYLSDLAEEWGLEPIDAALRLLDAGGAGLVSFNMSEEDIAHIMTREWTMGSSDGGLVARDEGRPHPRFYGAFPRRIARYVREREVLTLAEAVRGMTSLTTTVFRMHDRGQIAAGRIADLLVVDIEEFRDAATYQDPHALAEGIVHALVAGVFAIENGETTGALAGRVLTPHWLDAE
ncbi:MAG: amidohydrolase family protein [Acidobacteria bacterium]|nr:amidohydrolase family protein [Acidobacteriota bacterium]MYG74054.1 amidohydrolase family protein [Acidobacteriota bacterium]